MSHDYNARAGDADREDTVAHLKAVMPEGYLSLEEVTQRIGLALQEKTLGGLRKLTEDLPPAPVIARHPKIQAYLHSGWFGGPLIISGLAAWAGTGLLDHLNNGRLTGLDGIFTVFFTLYGFAALIWFAIWGEEIK